MWIVAIPIGIYSATHQYSVGDNLLTMFGLPGPVRARLPARPCLSGRRHLRLQYLGDRALFPGHGGRALVAAESRSTWPSHLFWPALILGAAGMAQLIRIMRGSLLEILGAQYITTARAKGLKERVVINKYAVRVAINP